MSDKPPEDATETVTIMASPELLAQLTGQWSPPVQVRAWPPTDLCRYWSLEIRTVPAP
jgi:hypothetical protein